MNFQDQIQQIFGTTDIHELKQISRDADNYRCLNADMNNSIISEKKKNTGRKNSFTEEQLAQYKVATDLTPEETLQILPDSITFPVRRFTVR